MTSEYKILEDSEANLKMILKSREDVVKELKRRLGIEDKSMDEEVDIESINPMINLQLHPTQQFKNGLGSRQQAYWR